MAADSGSKAKIDEVGLDFTSSHNQMLVIEAVRLGFLIVVLAVSLTFQAIQPEFLNVEVLLPVYVLLSVSFLLNGIYLLFFEQALRTWLTTAFLFFFESIFITFLIYFSGINQSIFIFLYLINIILCGFVFQRRGAMILSLATSIQFSVLVILGPELKGQTLFFAVGLNNLAFFTVAALSGYLSEQLNFMGVRLRAQGKDLRAQRNITALIVENIATGLVTLDIDGIVLISNRAAIDILDPVPRNLLGRNLEEILPGILARVRHLLDRKEPAERFDCNYVEPGGESLTLEIIASALPEESSIAGYILAFQDLTKVRRLEFQMRQSEKMAAVGQLAAGIAHEIRNPLASISGSIQLLGGSFTARQEEEQQLMKIVLKEIDRLNNLVTEFLDFVRPDTLKDDPVDLNSLVGEVVDLVKMNQSLRKDIRFEASLNAKQVVGGHRDKLKQALMNIVINACQAMNDTANPTLTVSSWDVDGKVMLKIKDSGCGIDEGRLRKIFEPFHTTKPKGTGLGLAVTHKIIESHGGRIYVESQKGTGTEFILEIPSRTPSGLDKNALADSLRASENFQIAFRGQKRGNG